MIGVTVITLINSHEVNKLKTVLIEFIPLNKSSKV